MKYQELKQIQRGLLKQGIETYILKVPSYDGWTYELRDKQNIPLKIV